MWDGPRAKILRGTEGPQAHPEQSDATSGPVGRTRHGLQATEPVRPVNVTHPEPTRTSLDDPWRAIAKSDLVQRMYRLQSSIFRSFQVLGTVMAVAGAGAAIMWTTQGQNGDALFAGLVALGSVGCVVLAGRMRRATRRAAEFFPPKAR